MVSEDLTVHDRSARLELLEEVVISDFFWEITHEDARVFVEVCLLSIVCPLEGLAILINQCSRIAQALIVSEAKLSADLLVEGDHEDFGGVHGNFAKLLFKDLLCGALDHVFQEETVSLCERVGPPHRILLFGLRRCLSALTARANLFLLLLH